MAIYSCIYLNYLNYVGPGKTFEQSRVQIIKAHLKYASVVWSPHLAKDMKSIEGVQKFALRFCLSHLHKIMPIAQNYSRGCVYLKPPCTAVGQQQESRHLNSQQLTVQFARSNYFKSSFFLYTTALWNSVKFHRSEIGSIGTFKFILQNMRIVIFVLFVVCLVPQLQISISLSSYFLLAIVSSINLLK